MLYSSIVFLIGYSIVVVTISTAAEEQITKNASQWAKVISHKSIKALIDNAPKRLNDDLQTLTSITELNYIYIYRLNPEEKQKVKLFSSYKRGSNFYQPPDTLAQLTSLLSPQFYDNYFEFSVPINNSDQLIGYLYIQFDLDDLNMQIFKLAIYTLVIAIMMLLIAFAIVARLQRTVTAPIQQLITNIQLIAQQKDFSMRCDDMPYQELDILAKNINIMLSRAERYIARQEESEQQFIQLNKSLEDKVSHRTDALKESNQELLSTLETLHQYQGQLVESEKMASLGDMVAGVAHEVNTPIGLGVTSSSLLYDRLVDIKQAFENKTLKSSQLKKFFAESDENLNIIMRNLQRAADLITSFKQVAVDQSSSEDRRFNFKGLLREVVLTLAPQLKNTNYKVEFDCPEDLIITSKPGPINQVLVNLIINSIIHGFDGREYGTISIAVVLLKNQISIQYHDDGMGIKEEIKSKIFDPFITTKRGSGGSGLGMHLVYNLITQALNGTISFESYPNAGVTFDINFPILNE
ncbi:MAG: histidine kinase [Gammaproteobacteria bacterium]|nr:MAG: histidine kinase [Gammaproteobacteria bacterium]